MTSDHLTVLVRRAATAEFTATQRPAAHAWQWRRPQLLPDVVHATCVEGEVSLPDSSSELLTVGDPGVRVGDLAWDARPAWACGQRFGMEYSRFLECLAADFARLRAVVPTDPTAGVPTCPSWTVADLTRHVGEVYLHKTPGHARGRRA